MRRYALIEAPSILGLASTGVDRLPTVLQQNGLGERIRARTAARLEPPMPDGVIDRQTGIRNAHAIARWTPTLADAVGDVLDRDELPIVLGGDCSIVLGSMLALARRGRHGLLFIDGHADFYQPEAVPTGEAASMDLALVTGHGPPLLANIGGRGPLVRPADAVAFGFRDHAEQAEYGSQPLPADLLGIDLARIRRDGIDAATTTAVEHLESDFWIHIDADVLDDAVMPAVDYRTTGGLHPDELRRVLAIALGTGRAVGLEVTIYNPALDASGAAGRLLASILGDALAHYSQSSASSKMRTSSS
jgi:arginase